jgi:glycerol-3-phosphate acyltransferase PlsX
MDYAEYGGAPLLGLNGTCIVAHGRSNAQAIKNAIRVAAQAVEQDVVHRIAEGIQSSGSELADGVAEPTEAAPG